jgi:hypothetical protein
MLLKQRDNLVSDRKSAITRAQQPAGGCALG